jgi:hypothetical protein
MYMKLRLTLIAAAVTFLAGCANTQEYKLYADTQRGIAQAEAIAEAARWNALQEIAKSGDTTAKVAAAMALQAGGQRGGSGARQNIAPPKSSAEIALQWTSLLLPNLAQFYSINRNSAVAIQQSNNATALGIKQSDNQATVTANTNATFANIAGTGLSTAATIAAGGFNSIANVAGAGLNAATTASNNSVAITQAHANAMITLTNTLPDLVPIVTTTTSTVNNNTVAAP